MKTISDGIRQTIGTAKQELLKISPENAGKKIRPEVWSKKEILGHLIDSASNNHQRFVRGAQNIASDFPLYNQNRWVEVQHYNEEDWSAQIELFYYLNLHICHVIDSLPNEAMENLCNFGKESPVSLGFVIQDYLRHMKHHLEKILED